MNDRFTVVPAAYVMLRKGNQVLLIRRAHTGYRDGEYAFPAGHLDGGESAQHAAAREAYEEVGVTINEADLECKHVIHRLAEERDHERVDFFFETTAWQGEPKNMEPHKHDDVQWFDVDNLPSNTTPITRQVLEHVKVGSYYSNAGF